MTRRHVVGVGGLEDRPQLALEPAQRACVAVGALRVQPLAAGEVGRPASSRSASVGVEQARRRLGVPDEVHAPSLRLGRGRGTGVRTAVIRWTANVRMSSLRWS